MAPQFLGKIAATLLLGLSMAACVDMDMNVELTSATTAKTTLTTTMSSDFYAMVKMSAEAEGEDGAGITGDGFCETGDITETADGGAVCVEVMEASLDELNASQADENGLKFEAAGDNLVRVSMPLDGSGLNMGEGEEMDAETKAMVQSMFEGRAITISISGVEIVETNMETSADGKTASVQIEFTELLADKPNLPEEFFALVRTP